MDTILHLEGQLEFIVFFVSVLRFAFTNRVLSNLHGEAFANLGFLIVLKHDLHVTDLVVKGDILGEGEHGAVVEDFAGLGVGADEIVFHGNGECVVLLDHEVGDLEVR